MIARGDGVRRRTAGEAKVGLIGRRPFRRAVKIVTMSLYACRSHDQGSGMRDAAMTRPVRSRPILLVGAAVAALAGAVLLVGPVGAKQQAQPQAAASASDSGGTAWGSGKMTYYGADGGGHCSFEQVGGGMFVALGPSAYANSGACGSYFDVSNAKGTVRVKVTDECPECEAGHLDMSMEAFTKLGLLQDGILAMTYRQVVDPPLPGPLTVRVKEGANAYWFAVRIDNHGNPLTLVELKVDGSWMRLERSIYNYWLKQDGAGSGPFTLRLTDKAGHQVTLEGITLTPERVQQTTTWMYGA